MDATELHRSQSEENSMELQIKHQYPRDIIMSISEYYVVLLK